MTDRPKERETKKKKKKDRGAATEHTVVDKNDISNDDNEGFGGNFVSPSGNFVCYTICCPDTEQDQYDDWPESTV